MPAHIYDLEAEVLNLGPAERAHLLERLIESFEPRSKIQDAGVARVQTRFRRSEPYGYALTRVRCALRLRFAVPFGHRPSQPLQRGGD